MKVAELKILIQALPDDCEVAIQNHHRDINPIVNPRIRIMKLKGKTEVMALVLPEDYSV